MRLSELGLFLVQGSHPTNCGIYISEHHQTPHPSESEKTNRVEHVFQVMKLKFGFVKVRYRGLKKNAHRLFVTCALVNLFVSRKKLLAVA
jgi:IS5 family transposase